MPFETLLLILILLAGGYLAWSIGANDVANAMGTSVGSGALTLKQAVCIAAVLEFTGACFFGSHVSETMQSGIVNATIFENDHLLLVIGMLSALLAAGIWLQTASYYGWPVSTTHSIVGAMVGFGIIAGGVHGIYWSSLGFIALSWIISPLLGGVISFLIFNYLRKRVFFSADPLLAAKRLMPWLAGIMVGVLASIVLLKETRQISDAPQLVLLIALISVATAILAHFYIAKLIPPQPVINQGDTAYAPEIALEFDKATKHLKRIAKASAAGEETRYRTTMLLNEIKHMSHHLKRSTSPLSTQYIAVEQVFSYLQIMSACLMAFAHGANDVSNAIGPLVAALSALETGHIVTSAPIPTWALALGGFGIIVGLATWGWRVIETIGKKITELTPSRGFAAEFAAAVTILTASRLGLPISTTHTLVGAVLGIGLARGLEALDMSTTRDIVISWLVTIPAGACSAMLFFTFFRYIFDM
jgi:PiT family inorganic phosphate transporter